MKSLFLADGKGVRATLKGRSEVAFLDSTSILRTLVVVLVGCVVGGVGGGGGGGGGGIWMHFTSLL